VGCLYNKGIALDKLGQHEQAKEYESKARQINPDYSGEFINKVSTSVSIAGDIASKAAI
jgi:tetratricopeptide (TPR) repeat protein